MNVRETKWAHRYQSALRKYLARGDAGSLRAATGLGDQAVALDLETLDVARVHEQAMMARVWSVESLTTRKKIIGWATRFFAETIIPIENTHSAALDNDTLVNELTRTLRRRTAESTKSIRNLEQGIARRQASEEALRKSGQKRARLLEESRRLKKSVRDQARNILLVQEAERSKTSRQLHDEIVQMLLAINLRLLMLNTSTRRNNESFKKEIAETQKLVKESVKSSNRVAHEFVIPHKA